MNGAWDTPTARRAKWPRPKMDSGVVTAIIVYVSGTVLMIAAGVFLVLMGPQG